MTWFSLDGRSYTRQAPLALCLLAVSCFSQPTRRSGGSGRLATFPAATSIRAIVVALCSPSSRGVHPAINWCARSAETTTSSYGFVAGPRAAIGDMRHQGLEDARLTGFSEKYAAGEMLRRSGKRHEHITTDRLARRTNARRPASGSMCAVVHSEGCGPLADF